MFYNDYSCIERLFSLIPIESQMHKGIALKFYANEKLAQNLHGFGKFQKYRNNEITFLLEHFSYSFKVKIAQL